MAEAAVIAPTSTGVTSTMRNYREEEFLALRCRRRSPFVPHAPASCDHRGMGPAVDRATLVTAVALYTAAVREGGLTMATAGSILGNAVRRLEDPTLLTGEGKYVDDLVEPGMLHVAFARSTVAHGDLVAVDVSEAA